MSSGRNALAFAAGFGKGYIDARGNARRQQQDDEDRARRNELQDVQLRAARRTEDDALALRQAAAPVTMQEGAGGALRPDTMDDRDVGQPGEAAPTPGGFRVGGQDFGDRGAAEVALSQANSPQARNKRIADTLTAQGKPTEAMKFQAEAQDYASRAWNSMIRDAIPQGHAGLAEVITGSEAGPFKGKQVKPVPSPDGKTVTYAIVNPDGTTTPTPYTFSNDQNGVIKAGYMLANVSPEVRYRNMVDADKAAWERQHKERELNEVKIPLAEARGQAALAQGAAAEARGEAALARAEVARNGGDAKVDAEDRKRWTTFYNEAGRRLDDANKTLRQFQGDVAFMARARRPGTPEAQQLANVQADVETYKGDRDLYGSLLGGKKRDEAITARDAKPAGAPAAAPAGGKGGARGSTAAIAQPQSKAEYDALPLGTKYRHPSGDVRIKGGAPAKT